MAEEFDGSAKELVGDDERQSLTRKAYSDCDDAPPPRRRIVSGPPAVTGQPPSLVIRIPRPDVAVEKTFDADDFKGAEDEQTEWSVECLEREGQAPDVAACADVELREWILGQYDVHTMVAQGMLASGEPIVGTQFSCCAGAEGEATHGFCCVGGNFCFRFVKNGKRKPNIVVRTPDQRECRSLTTLRDELNQLQGEATTVREGAVAARLQAYAKVDHDGNLTKRALWKARWLEQRDRVATESKGDNAELHRLAGVIKDGKAYGAIVYRARHLTWLNLLGRPLCYVGLTRGVMVFLDEDGTIWLLTYDYLKARRWNGHLSKSKTELRTICFASHLGADPASWVCDTIYAHGSVVPADCVTYDMSGKKLIGEPLLPEVPVLSTYAAVTTSVSATEIKLIAAEGGTMQSPVDGPTLNISSGGSGSCGGDMSTVSEEFVDAYAFSAFCAAYEIFHLPVEQGGFGRAPRINCENPDIFWGVNLTSMCHHISSDGSYLAGRPEREEVLRNLEPPFIFSRHDATADAFYERARAYVEAQGDKFDGKLPKDNTTLGQQWKRVNIDGMIVRGRPELRAKLAALGVDPGMWSRYP